MKRFQEVSPGILRGSLPTADEIRALKDAWDIKRIISLDLKAGKEIDTICNKLDIEHLILPIEHDGIDTERKMERSIKFLSDNIIDLLTAKQPVYIHCVHGRDRTGLAVALYRIKAENVPVKKALEEAKSLEFGEGLSPDHLHIFLEAIRGAESEGDLNSTDVAQKARDSFDPGSTTGEGTGYNYFSPIPPVQEFVVGYPKSPIQPESFSADDKSRKRKRDLRKAYFENANDKNDAMGYVGLNENVSPMLRNVNPDGVGPLGILPYGNYYL